MKKVSAQIAFDKFKPESCVFVICFDKKNDRPSGMVAGWNMKCSSEPYMFAVALWKKGYTHKLIQQTKEFVVAIPNKGLKRALEFFGTTHGDKVNKFAKTKIKIVKAKYLKLPLLSDATVNLECKLEKEVNSGDHIIFIGKVVAAYINKDKKVLLNMGRGEGKRIFQEF